MIVARQILRPRKQRTRQHIIADQSVNLIERFIIDEGHTVQRLFPDYGNDLLLFTYDGNGFTEEGSVYMQLKASETLSRMGSNYVFDLDIRDYNRWRHEPMPAILVLFDASRRRAYWLYLQGYFAEEEARRPRSGAKTVRVQVPHKQAMNRRAIAKIRLLKESILDQLEGAWHV